MLNRLSRGRFLWTPEGKRGSGAFRLTTTGRRSGEPRSVILAYLTDGDGFSVIAMNGWMPGHPDWLVNLRANPAATVTLKGGATIQVVARVARGAERERIWQRWVAVDPKLQAWATARATPTPVVVLKPSG
ncbi:MAG: nitroreductase family deazaflavin-dependent oxidoreductase [Tetrasphaera sp.]